MPPGPAPTAAPLASFKSLPAFCRVQGVIQPSSDSHIEFEVWLPVSGWSHDFMGVGNGGLAGSISYTSPGNILGMAQELAAGFAVSSTDTGHQVAQGDGQWALGHPEKIVDYGYRAIHETAEKSKAIIRAFYRNGPRHSYFDSCSNGGREALMEAQRFPADYQGIIAGAPVYLLTHVMAGRLAVAQMTDADGYIPASKLPAIESAALAACDALDGLKDGLIDDPRKCQFDPATLLCQAAESNTCLTQPQVAALKKLYAGARTSKGDQIYPGYFPGGETGVRGWSANITGSGPGTSARLDAQIGKYVIFQNPAWDYRTFDVDRDVKIIDDVGGQRLNATDPNLKSFKSRGGKLILFHGWSDALIAPTGTIDYYETESFTRLYMVPGMQHCFGGPGPNEFGSDPVQILSCPWALRTSLHRELCDQRRHATRRWRLALPVKRVPEISLPASTVSKGSMVLGVLAVPVTTTFTGGSATGDAVGAVTESMGATAVTEKGDPVGTPVITS